MKLLGQKSVGFLCLLGLVQCAQFRPSQKVKANRWQDKLSSVEIQLKDQADEINRLKSVIAQMKKKESPTASQEPTLGSLMNGKSMPETSKWVPTTKLIPPSQTNPETASADESTSPLMDSAETIADSSQESMLTYYRGVQLLGQKKYEEAIESFKSFIQQNPDHVYADRAQFLIVDSHFRNKDYDLVLIESRKLENRFPYSFKIPAALYQRGLSYGELKQNSLAKNTFEQILKEYPKDPVAEVVRKKWANLGTESTSQIK